jgi:hypothetical protein
MVRAAIAIRESTIVASDTGLQSDTIADAATCGGGERDGKNPLQPLRFRSTMVEAQASKACLPVSIVKASGAR